MGTARAAADLQYLLNRPKTNLSGYGLRRRRAAVPTKPAEKRILVGTACAAAVPQYLLNRQKTNFSGYGSRRRRAAVPTKPAENEF